MRNPMGILMILAIAGVAVSILLASRPVLACIATIRATEAYLEKAREKSAIARYKDKTAIRWLRETGKALADAKRDCDKTEGFFWRRAVATRVLGLRAKMATAAFRIDFENSPSNSTKRHKSKGPAGKSQHLSGEP